MRVIRGQWLTSILGLLAALSLLGCSAPPGAASAEAIPGEAQKQDLDLAARYAALGAAGERIYQLEPQHSEVRIYAFRAGKAAKLGHNHVLSAPKLAGYFHLPREGTSKAGFELAFRLDELQLDAAEERARLGSAFASEFTPEDIQSTREHMLGVENLQAQQFPWVRIDSLQIVGEPPKFAAQVRVELHGRQQPTWIALNVEGLPDHLAVTGALVLRQSDFGVHPYSALGGLLAIQDAVLIEFHLVGQ